MPMLLSSNHTYITILRIDVHTMFNQSLNLVQITICGRMPNIWATDRFYGLKKNSCFFFFWWLIPLLWFDFLCNGGWKYANEIWEMLGWTMFNWCFSILRSNYKMKIVRRTTEWKLYGTRWWCIPCPWERDQLRSGTKHWMCALFWCVFHHHRSPHQLNSAMVLVPLFSQSSNWSISIERRSHSNKGLCQIVTLLEVIIEIAVFHNYHRTCILNDVTIQNTYISILCIHIGSAFDQQFNNFTMSLLCCFVQWCFILLLISYQQSKHWTNKQQVKR